jgi:hypothetical protein
MHVESLLIHATALAPRGSNWGYFVRSTRRRRTFHLPPGAGGRYTARLIRLSYGRSLGWLTYSVTPRSTTAQTGRVAALGEANLPIFSHFCGIIGFARFASDGVAAESVSAERCTERVGGRAMLKQNCKSSFLS